MIQLPNNCYCGDFSVNPKNWKQITASIKKDWYISYRFYDPAQKERYPKGKLRIVKGMNSFNSLESRRRATQEIIKIESDILSDGFNATTGAYFTPSTLEYVIKPTSFFLVALEKSLERLKTTKSSRYILKSCLKYISAASRQLGFETLEIQEIRRRHIKLILEQCGKNQAPFSAQSYNHYRAYLMMLFKELLELDTIEMNPVTDIKKMPVKRKIRATLSDKDRGVVDSYLLQNDPAFRRYVHIFFHSGSRIAELTRLQGKDVDLANQRFKITIKKGSYEHEVWRPIKNVVVSFWEAAILNCGGEDYVFSIGLVPGCRQVLNEYITKRWKRIIKDILKIEVDFYSLKHLNLDETAAQLGIQDAADMAGHTTPVITLLYAQGEKDRQNERLKKVGNKFA